MQGNPITEMLYHPIEAWQGVFDRLSALPDWSWRKKTPPEGKQAVVALEGDSGISGVVSFLKNQDGSIKVSGEVKGLTQGKHGLHVHEYGNSTDGCTSAGPHFNPFDKTHGSPTDDNRHMGDLGNVEANAAGVAKFTFTDKCIRLSGPYSIVGRSLVIHAGEDDLGRGAEDKREESLKTGNAGARVACGVIGHSSMAH